MSNRTDAQAGIDAQIAKQGTIGTINPTNQANTTLQPMLDGAMMIDEAQSLLDGTKESAIYERPYGAGSISFASPTVDIAVSETYNNSTDISKVSDSKIRLEPGFTYKIQGYMNVTCIAANNYVDFQLYDASNGAFVGAKGTVVLSNNTGNSGSQVSPVAYVSSTNAIEFELQFAGGDIVTGYSAAIVIEKVSSAASSGDLMTKNEFNEIANTYAALGYTQKTAASNLPLVMTGLIGTNDENLTPPDTPQPLTGGDYAGYIKITGFIEIEASESLTISNSEFVIGQDGNYYSSHAWLDVSCSVNTNNLGFIFGIERDNQLSFSTRPTGTRGFNGDNRTNVSGGGFLNNLQVGDKVSVWVASEKDADITIYDCNLGINLRSKN